MKANCKRHIHDKKNNYLVSAIGDDASTPPHYNVSFFGQNLAIPLRTSFFHQCGRTGERQADGGHIHAPPNSTTISRGGVSRLLDLKMFKQFLFKIPAIEQYYPKSAMVDQTILLNLSNFTQQIFKKI